MSLVAVTQPLPFLQRPNFHKLGTEENPPSIAEILAVHSEGLSQSFLEACEARINGHLIERKNWHRVRPRPNLGQDIVVTYTLPLQGGSSGKTLRTVASVAVLLVAAAVSGGALALPSVELFGATISLNAVAGVGIGLAGSLAIAALTPPPTLGQNQSLGEAAGKAAASLSGNVLSKGGPIPRVIGTHRIYPPFITPPLIEVSGDDTYAEAVYVLAGPHAISEIFVGNTTFKAISDVQIEIQEGLPNSLQVGLVQRQSYTDQSNSVQMSAHQVSPDDTDGDNLFNQTDPTASLPQWEGFTTRTAPDEFWLTLGFSAGLAINSNKETALPLRMRMRPVGGDDSDWIQFPEFHMVRQALRPFQVMVKLLWQAAPANPTPLNPGGGFRHFFSSVPTQAALPVGLGGWTADSYFYNGTGDTYWDSNNEATTGLINCEGFADQVKFYLNDPAKFPKSGRWEVQLMRGQSVRIDQFSPVTYQLNGSTVYDLFGYKQDNAAAPYEMLYDQRTVQDIVVVARASSIWNEHPVPNPTRLTQIAIRAKNRNVQEFSVLASNYVYDYNAATGNWDTLTNTSNPATQLRDVLVGNQGATALPMDLLDDFTTWRQRCIDDGLEVNAIVEGRTMWDVANLITGAGYARLWSSEKWGVVEDKDRSAESPVQIFTPRNMRDFAWTKAFARLPTGIRAAYNNSAEDYKPAELIVFADPRNPDATQLEQISYDGLVSESAVEKRASFDLKQIQLRLAYYSGTTSLESIVCRRGDLVGVVHDTLDQYGGFSRIKSIQTDNSNNITGMVLDGTIPILTLPGIFPTTHLFLTESLFDLGARTGVALRLKSGAGQLIKEVQAVANDDQTEITFAVPFAHPGEALLDVDCLVASGRLGQEYSRMIVFAIEPRDDFTAQITFVDEAPELWQ